MHLDSEKLGKHVDEIPGTYNNRKKKGKGGTKRKTGPSTCQVVFCFCFRGSANQQDAKKNAALNRQAEDDF